MDIKELDAELKDLLDKIDAVDGLSEGTDTRLGELGQGVAAIPATVFLAKLATIYMKYFDITIEELSNIKIDTS